MSFELICETQATGGWDRNKLPPTTESVKAGLEKLAAGATGSLKWLPKRHTRHGLEQ